MSQNRGGIARTTEKNIPHIKAVTISSRSGIAGIRNILKTKTIPSIITGLSSKSTITVITMATTITIKRITSRKEIKNNRVLN